MNQKKLIGTIIGVILFAAVIAGATYAWLTFSLTVTDGTYNSNTGTFLVDYTQAQNITSVPILTTATPSTAESKVITAKLHTGSVPGKLTISIVPSASTMILTSGVIHYAVCTSASSTSSGCSTDFTSAVATGVLNSADSKVLYADPNDLTTANRYYTVYFWIDAAGLTNEMLETGNNTFSGYIEASAAQTH